MNAGPSLDWTRVERIAVLRALQLGDLLCAVPALRALRSAAPKARITLVGLPGAAEFGALFGQYIDELLPLPGVAGLPESPPAPQAWPGFVKAAHRAQFQVALQLHGSGRVTNRIAQALGAPFTAGFVEARDLAASGLDWTVPWPESGSEIERLLTLVRSLGCPDEGDHLEWPSPGAAAAATAALCARHGLHPDGYVCVHPGARLESRRWPVARFAAVAHELMQSGWPVVLTGAPAEAALTGSLKEALASLPAAGRVVDLTGATSLAMLGELLRHARLIVANDTGVSHVASAVGTRSVIVACGSDTARWSPADPKRHRVLWADTPCRPCAYVTCPIGHPCALEVPSERVYAACTLQLAEA